MGMSPAFRFASIKLMEPGKQQREHQI